MKGQLQAMDMLFTLMFAAVGAATLALILPGQITRIEPEIEQKEIEQKAFYLANVLMSHPRLIYSDGESYYRGMFDFDKISEIPPPFIPKESVDSLVVNNLGAIFSPFPNSYTLGTLQDLENQKGWVIPIWHKTQTSDEFLNKITSCFSPDKFENKEIQKLFDDVNIAEFLKLKDCGFSFNSDILNTGFPVGIRYSEVVTHTAILKILVVE